MRRALSRKYANRNSMLRNLATSLVLYERVKTTTAKAKEVKPLVERLINSSKSGDLSARRRLMAFFFDGNATRKIMEELAPRYKDVASGFIKSYKMGNRIGDGSEMTILELMKIETKEENDSKKTGGEETASKEKPGRRASTKETGTK